tara:strand:+ start:4718 stop:5437 length:720 start_codon:yes stop_codon:yes gene_type:complete
LVFKLKVILLTTKTLHHLYLIKKIENIKNLDLIIFFINDKSYKFYSKSEFENKENKFEKHKFFKNKTFKTTKKIFYIKDINSIKTLNLIKKIKPNLGILFGTKKVETKIINAFKKKLINIHRGIMQKYRGLDSEYWAIYNNDFNSVGATIHFVNKFLDKGKIIFEKKLDLKKNIKCYHLKYYTTLLATKYIIQIIKTLMKKNKLKFLKKQKVGNYYSKIDIKRKEIACKNLQRYLHKKF